MSAPVKTAVAEGDVAVASKSARQVLAEVDALRYEAAVCETLIKALDRNYGPEIVWTYPKTGKIDSRSIPDALISDFAEIIATHYGFIINQADALEATVVVRP